MYGRRRYKRRSFRSKGRFRKVGVYGRYNRGFGKNRELKWLDTVIAGVNLTQTGGTNVSNCLNVLPQGLNASERIGNKVTVKSIAVKMRYQLASSIGTAATFNRFKVALVLDRQANGVTAPWDECFEDQTVDTHRNLTAQARFKVLRSWTKAVNQIAPAYDSAVPQSYNNAHIGSMTFYKRCNIPIYFDGVTGAIATVQSNNLAILGLMGSVAPNVTISATVRIRYSDD